MDQPTPLLRWGKALLKLELSGPRGSVAGRAGFSGARVAATGNQALALARPGLEVALRGAVTHEQTGQVEIEEHIPVHEQKGLVPEEVTDLPRPPARPQDPPLMRVTDAETQLPAVTHRRDHGLRPVVQVDQAFGHALARQKLQRPVQQRPVQHGEDGLGAPPG